jgi:epoxyqueuosine reductase QueG
VTLLVADPPAGANASFRFGAQYQVDSLCYDLTRALEDTGHRSIMTIKRAGPQPVDPQDVNPTSGILRSVADLDAEKVVANTVLTRKPLAPERRGGVSPRSVVDHGNAAADLTSHLVELARSLGADLVGVAPVSRLEEMVPQLRPVFEVDVLDASDRSPRFMPWMPEVAWRRRTLKTPGDWLPGARSVLVFGLRYHREVLRWATKPPAEAVGPYAYETYVTHWLGAILGYRLIRELSRFGHAGVMTADLTNTASVTASPRTPQPDLFANRFAALAAGLGYLTVSGHLATPQFGLRQRVVAIVTDAPLAASPLVAPAADDVRCARCDRRCVSACPSRAIAAREASVACEGVSWRFNVVDALRCDWVKRYALMGGGGYKYLGSSVDIAPPETIAPEALSEALRQLDPIKKYRPVAAEPCVIQCPLATER